MYIIVNICPWRFPKMAPHFWMQHLLAPTVLARIPIFLWDLRHWRCLFFAHVVVPQSEVMGGSPVVTRAIRRSKFGGFGATPIGGNLH